MDKPYGTALEELGLPGTVTITTVDGKTFDKIPVTWSGYDPNTLEEQTLTALSQDFAAPALKAKVPSPLPPVRVAHRNIGSYFDC